MLRWVESKGRWACRTVAVIAESVLVRPQNLQLARCPLHTVIDKNECDYLRDQLATVASSLRARALGAAKVMFTRVKARNEFRKRLLQSPSLPIHHQFTNLPIYIVFLDFCQAEAPLQLPYSRVCRRPPFQLRGAKGANTSPLPLAGKRSP